MVFVGDKHITLPGILAKILNKIPKTFNVSKHVSGQLASCTNKSHDLNPLKIVDMELYIQGNDLSKKFGLLISKLAVA